MLHEYLSPIAPVLKNLEVVIFDDLCDCVEVACSHISSGVVALAGGSTLTRLYNLLISVYPEKTDASFFPLDERCVEFTDPASNWGAISRNFLSTIGKKEDSLHWAKNALEYNTILQSFFKKEIHFDSILMSMGDDGHVASLFPNEPYLSDKKSVVLSTQSPKPPASRYTLGPKVIMSANKAILFIEGCAKQAVANAFLQGNMQLPAVEIMSQRQNGMVFIQKSLVSTPS